MGGRVGAKDGSSSSSSSGEIGAGKRWSLEQGEQWRRNRNKGQG